MVDDNRSFSLQQVRESINGKFASLKTKDDADVRSRDDISRRKSDDRAKPFTFQQEDFDRTEPPKDEMRRYWRQFETTPIIRKPITSFASQVTEPGYYIKARGLDEEQLRELDKWLQKCAIIEGETGKDFRLLAKKAAIQREVRGTALIEKAPDKNDPDKIAGLKLINPETMEAVTRPGQSILMAPDDIEKEEYEGVPAAGSGGAAAYLQDLSETNTFFGTPVRQNDRDSNTEDFKIGFRRDEIIKLTRDADVGEIFGTSRIEAVSDRIDGIQQKLKDNDKAIESKAYPLWLFMFGTEENPWESSDITNFMRAHEMENFHPGMKQGVRGDVDVQTISGEVADISQALEFDLNWIMSAMPMPKFALGAFDGAVGQVGGMAQQQDVNRQINEARQEIEDEFTPLLREVATQIGISEEQADDIRLKIGTPGEPETEVPQRENIIRYIPENQRKGKVGGEDEPQEEDGESEDDQTIDDGEVDMPANEGGIDNIENGQIGIEPEQGIPEDMLGSRGAHAWHMRTNMEQLSIEPDDSQAALADKIFDTMVETRENVLNEIESEYADTPTFAVTNFERTANSVLRRQMGRGRFRDDVEPIVTDTIASIEESLSGETGRFSRSQNARFYVQDIENATEDAIEEMLRLMRIQTRRAVLQNEEWAGVRRRVETEYDDMNLRQRAELIAHMELTNAKETTRLQQWESNDDIIGVRVSNENAHTPLTQSLNGATAFFDEGDISDQLMAQTRSEFLHEGFDPLPPTPPFHFQDTSRLEPIIEGN